MKKIKIIDPLPGGSLRGPHVGYFARAELIAFIIIMTLALMTWGAVWLIEQFLNRAG